MNVFSFRRHTGKQTTSAGLLLVALCLLATMLIPASEADAAAATCDGRTVTINMNNGATGAGTNGDDVILGTPGRDTIQGRGGNDVICGGGGSDRIRGHGGNDIILAGSGNDQVWGGPGDDNLRGMGGNDVLYGGASHDTLGGSTGDDKLYGEGGWDKIYAGPGNDTALGGDGNDTISGQDGNDTLDGQAGSDTINGGPGTNNCTGETLTNCGPYSPPDWTTDAGITLTKVSEYDFEIQWCCSAGPLAELYELTLIRSDGATSTDSWTYSTANSKRIWEWGNRGSLAGYTYFVELRTRNAAGLSEPLTLGPIGVLERDRQVTINGQETSNFAAAAAAFSTSRSVDGTFKVAGYGDCPHRPLDFKSFEKVQILFKQLFHHEAHSKVCHNGTRFTYNHTKEHICEKAFKFDKALPVITEAPDAGTLINRFHCVWNADVRAAIELELKVGKVSPQLAVEIGFKSDGAQTFEHIMTVEGDAVEITMSRWDGADGPS